MVGQEIGPAKSYSLMAGRRNLESHFRFDPALGVSQSQRAAVDRRVLQSRAELERSIAQYLEGLRGLHRTAIALRSPDLRRLDEAARRRAQARADAEALEGQ